MLPVLTQFACRLARCAQRETPPVRTSEHSSWIVSHAFRWPGAATSLIVACDPDGWGAVYSRWSLLEKAGRMLRQRLSHCFHQSSRSPLFQIGSATYQLVYELHVHIQTLISQKYAKSIIAFLIAVLLLLSPNVFFYNLTTEPPLTTNFKAWQFSLTSEPFNCSWVNF